MVNEVIDGISITLANTFDDIAIYSETVEQGFIEPCFFITNLTSSESPLLGNRAKRNMAFDVHYFPRENNREECHDVAAELYGLLRRITLLDGSELLGWNLHHEIIDDILHFFVEFKPTILYIRENAEEMRGLDVNVREI